ncbi:MAG TPA: hypothetical protein VH277_05840 [Gemmatimonadaceae bacterium]|jgi:hypothetical protein|nr:hypothetical protein [Gemmatimonadaceae bacterium]
MRKLIGGAAAAVALVVIVFSTAHADQVTPGQPGTPNCRGQMTAFFAQAAKNGLLDDALRSMGVGGLARASGLTVSELHDLVEVLCTAPPKP